MDLAVILGMMLMMYIAWSIGANDAANPTECAVGAGVISVRRALAIFTAFVFIGSLLQGWMVMKTFGGGISKIVTLQDALIASASTGLWITIASLLGLPISTTHSAVGAVLGIGISHLFIYGSTSINYSVLVKVIISWVTSPLTSILLVALLYKLLNRLYMGMAIKGLNPSRLFRYLLIATLAFSAYSFGANDVGNATGVYLTVIRVGGSVMEGLDINTALMLAALGSVGIALGGFTVGYRVIETVAFKITRLDLLSATAAELANALSVWLFTTIPYVLFGYGMPISTTHSSVSAVIGVGLLRGGLKGVDKYVVLRIIASWIATVPLTAGAALSLRVLTHILLSA